MKYYTRGSAVGAIVGPTGDVGGWVCEHVLLVIVGIKTVHAVDFTPKSSCLVSARLAQ